MGECEVHLHDHWLHADFEARRGSSGNCEFWPQSTASFEGFEFDIDFKLDW